jgi:prepilin-type N-terminal cleavage/methylation domain-containing protein
MRRESGFTLIELLVVIGISAVLMTLAASAVRHFWFVNAADGAAEKVVSELRGLQQRTAAESHPMVYGAWFKEDVETAQWGILKYDPKDASSSSDDVCSPLGTAQRFGDGVTISNANFDSAGSTIDSKCAAAAPAGSDLVFFYARGSATAGTISLDHEAISAPLTVEVSGVTGRVELQ